MKRTISLISAVIALAAGLTATAQETAKPATPPQVFMEKVTVVVDGKAETAGNIQLEVQPLGATARTISVTVLAKDTKKEIAKALHRELTVAAGPAYKVKLSGTEVRITKANSKNPNLSVTIGQLAVTGVSVLISRG
jgi:hypothetical protein